MMYLDIRITKLQRISDRTMEKEIDYQREKSINSNDTYELSNDIILQELSLREKQYWCFNTASGDYFKLNETSFQFLMCFQQACSFKSALERFGLRCKNLPNSAVGDLMELLKKSVELAILINKTGGKP